MLWTQQRKNHQGGSSMPTATDASTVNMIKAVISRKGIAKRIADRVGEEIESLGEMTYADLESTGVTTTEYARLAAAIKIGVKIESSFRARMDCKLRITSPATAMNYCIDKFSDLVMRQQEEFWIVTLDTKNKPIKSHQITVGTLRNSLVHPREVFRPAIKDAANCLLLVHNHPSGDPTPSDQDISVTTRLESVAEIVGIPIIDHIVVAGRKAVSIKEWQSGNRWNA